MLSIEVHKFSDCNSNRSGAVHDDADSDHDLCPRTPSQASVLPADRGLGPEDERPDLPRLGLQLVRRRRRARPNQPKSAAAAEHRTAKYEERWNGGRTSVIEIEPAFDLPIDLQFVSILIHSGHLGKGDDSYHA